jgi:hypothetical protein
MPKVRLLLKLLLKRKSRSTLWTNGKPNRANVRSRNSTSASQAKEKTIRNGRRRSFWRRRRLKTRRKRKKRSSTFRLNIPSASDVRSSSTSISVSLIRVAVLVAVVPEVEDAERVAIAVIAKVDSVAIAKAGSAEIVKEDSAAIAKADSVANARSALSVETAANAPSAQNAEIAKAPDIAADSVVDEDPLAERTLSEDQLFRLLRKWMMRKIFPLWDKGKLGKTSTTVRPLLTPPCRRWPCVAEISFKLKNIFFFSLSFCSPAPHWLTT